MIGRKWCRASAALVMVVGLGLMGCGDDAGDTDNQSEVEPNQEDPNQETPNNQEPQECDLEYVLPEGTSFALEADEITEPSSIVPLVGGFIDSIPPLLLFADGLSDGEADELWIEGGVGELVDFGVDETPNTPEDVFSMYYGSISEETCEFQAILEGESVAYALEATAQEMEIDLGGFSSLTEGLALHVENVSLSGVFGEDLEVIDDVVLRGNVSERGVDELVELAQEYISISTEQAWDLLDPDDTGEILVELEMTGRPVVVDGFMDPTGDEDPVEPREPQECCPEGISVGDSVLDHLTWEQQGLSADQFELFQMALPEFRDDPYIAMLATARRQSDGTVHYEVYSGGAVNEGHIIFERSASDDGWAPDFEVVSQTGYNPLENVDPTVLSAYEEFLSTGINPNDITYADQGYLSEDPRLAFVPPTEMHYPYAMERIAQNFDDPRAGDLIIIPASWSTGGFGTHGNLGALQSRSPLVMAGPGIRQAESAGDDEVALLGDESETVVIPDAVRQVDIAPTVAAALGVEQRQGVGPDLRFRDDVYLAWQDGRVLEEIFTEDALDQIAAGEAVADRAVIIINDGLTNTELLFQTFSENDDFDVDAYRRMMNGGVVYEYGSISNFPSNTYPGHNTLGSGAWAGHHGVVDNRFWERDQAVQAAPISELFETEYLLGSAHEGLPVEMLFEAVARTFGDVSDGVLGASINEPSSRGAEFATLERRIPDGFEMPDGADQVRIGEEMRDVPPADLSDYAAVMDNDSLVTFAELFQDHELREEGLPIPRVSMVNFGSTDTAGHAHGPHGDQERYTVIARVNQRMEAMLDVLEYLEIDDSTLVVLTSDHGMELQDQSRRASRTRALGEAGVSMRRSGWFSYFKELEADLLEASRQGDEVVVEASVIDKATRYAESPAAVDELMVDVVAGADEVEVEGWEDEVVTLRLEPEADASEVMLRFDHDDWNATRLRIDLP